MKKSDLSFEYPEHLIALKPNRPSRVMIVENSQPSEISIQALLYLPEPGDVWVVNNTQVLPRRVFSEQLELEILFLKPCDPEQTEWEVLFPSSRITDSQHVTLPGGIEFKILARGLPQIIRLSKPISENYFDQFGELPLPPYIQKLRPSRHQSEADRIWYQTAWAKYAGSLAAPTASLHFSNEDIDLLRSRGIKVLEVTLHVGIGTFLPIKTEDLSQHIMHKEWAEVPQKVWDEIQEAKAQKKKVWALGTTVTRTLESIPLGYLTHTPNGYSGETQLFIKPGFRFQVLDRLMTNFHQPESTLLALVVAAQDLSTVKSCYQWAIQKEFRLFSYGDLSVWDIRS
jgi:S-adenosylmethionine:tRNA ribosyltransferase-isomerase